MPVLSHLGAPWAGQLDISTRTPAVCLRVEQEEPDRKVEMKQYCGYGMGIQG